MKIRRATSEDMQNFCKDRMPVPRSWGWVAIEDGKQIAIWGLAYFSGMWYCFCDLEPEALRHKITMMKQAKKLMAFAEKTGIKNLYVVADMSKPRSISWILSLGFENIRGTVFKWQP